MMSTELQFMEVLEQFDIGAHMDTLLANNIDSVGSLSRLVMSESDGLGVCGED